ncbi:MAG: biotin--[acetyl-CoA-carboxylase] ligase [Eubacterium sp.]|nr:biotin--[acetyl-CoA-carboxylase] ligase [Eubacterium sp.]
MKSRSKVLRLLELHRGDYLSGEQLANALGLSRSGIWKIIRSLRAEGYAIDAKTNVGYRLAEDSSLLSREALLPLIKDPTVGEGIQVFDTLPSTNTQAKRLAQEGAPHGTTVIAREQSAGRGRLGRSFYSPKNSGLYLSLILRPALLTNQSLYITAAVGTLLCQIVKKVANLDLKIKWVNDLYHEGRKVCGILTEAAADFETGTIDYIVVGIGINLQRPSEGFPEDIQSRAGALFADHSPERLNIRLAAEIINTLTDPDVFKNQEALMTDYKRRSLVLNREVRLTGPAGELTGIGTGFTPEGVLILKTAEGDNKIISSGEVSLRFGE